MIRSFPLLLVFVLVTVVADDLLEDRGNARTTFFAELRDVERQGDRAFVFGVGGFMIFDVGDPDAPTLLGRWVPDDVRPTASTAAPCPAASAPAVHERAAWR